MLQANTGKHFAGRLWKVSLVSFSRAAISSESKIVYPGHINQ